MDMDCDNIFRYVCNDLIGLNKEGTPSDASDELMRDLEEFLQNELQQSPEVFLKDILADGRVDCDNQSSGSVNDDEVKAAICPVCTRPTGKHSYYGGRVCVSCRGFFRRSVQNKHYPLFRCVQGGQCRIDSQSRMSCKLCRFQKCLSSGMKITYVMSDTQRKELVLQRISKKDQLQTSCVGTIKKPIQLHFSIDECKKYKNLFRHFMDYGHAKYYDYYSQKLASVKDFVNVMLGSGRLTKETFLTMLTLETQLMTNFSFDLPDMAELSAYDRMALISNNVPLAYSVVCAAYANYRDLMTYVKDFVDFGQRYMSQNPSAEAVMAEVTANFRPPSDPDTPINYSFLLPPEREERTLELERHVGQISPILRSREKDGSVDPIIVMLLIKMVLFFPGVSSCSNRLEKKVLVEEKHSQFAWTLHRYLKEFYPEVANSRLHHAVMVMALDSNVLDLFKP